MEFVDTHCHIHEIVSKLTPVYDKWHGSGKLSAEEVVNAAHKAGVSRMICVGTTAEDSQLAIQFGDQNPTCWASIGIHPHEAARYQGDQKTLVAFAALAIQRKVVAVGECGLDYFYARSPKEAQREILKFQMELALVNDLPMIFHVRDAFEDFWPIFDSYHGLRGVIHSFSATQRELDEILRRGLYVGLNGIMTFTKRSEQLEAARAVPLDKLVLETDAPFLTPVPERGKICQPKHVVNTANFLAALRNEDVRNIAAQTTKNAVGLFNLAN